jgi:hypothetical protein
MWKKEQIIDVFFRRLQRIKRFLTGKDLFAFLFFLAISTAVWGLHAMRKTYETTIQIPVIYENLPEGYVQMEKLPDNLRVTVTNKGNVLLRYRFTKRFSPISVNMEDFQKEEPGINTKTLEPAILKQLNATTQITSITPELLRFKFVRLENKTIPVKLDGRIDLAQQHTLSDPVEITPGEVTVYAPENILDTMRFAHTDPLILTNLKETIRQSVKLKEIKEISYSPPSVMVTVKTELYTEKTVEVPISVVNVPHGRTLRVFPSVVSVSFQVGLSLYDKINASSFVLAVDYNETSRKKLPVEIKKQPEKIFNARINPQYVDYLIEENN